MAESKPLPMLCIYRVKAGKEAEFRTLLDRHWPTLHRLGLATSEPAKIWKGRTKKGSEAYVEMFAWKDEKAVHVAHQTPELMQVWEPMGALTEDMEFLNVEPVQPGQV